MNHPERLGKYQITGVLGEGAMGVVYRGFDPDIRRVVALKTIRHMGSGEGAAEQSAARFRNEAQAAGRLLHPGIVGVYDFGDDGRVAFIAMEYVEGHTLSKYLAARVPFSNADIASIAAQLLDALGHAHEHGVWHRDIKPSNVIMTKSGRVKIADFGIARTDTSGITMVGSVLGTPMYMAPEQFMGRDIDHRADLYGVGVVLYQLLAGRPPFFGPPESLMYKVVNEMPLPPSQVESGTRHAHFDAVLATALAKGPADRFAHAAAFRDALAAALGQALPSAVSAQAVYALPGISDYAPTERISLPRTGVASPAAAAVPVTQGSAIEAPTPTHWDPAVLAKMEATLARHVGPLAAVLVRRAARECQDLPALYARLGEQITHSAAREAFLAPLTRSGTLGGGTGSGTGSGSGGATGGSHGGSGPRTGSGGSGGASGGAAAPALAGTTLIPGPPVSDALVEQAQRLLAGHMGPIARVVVKRAVERTRQREALFTLLVDAAPEPARAQLRADLERLP
jgi:serine/threonine-protein kinase